MYILTLIKLLVVVLPILFNGVQYYLLNNKNHKIEILTIELEKKKKENTELANKLSKAQEAHKRATSELMAAQTRLEKANANKRKVRDAREKTNSIETVPAPIKRSIDLLYLDSPEPTNQNSNNTK